MSPPVIQVASYLGPEGFGNDQTGLHPWPGAHHPSLQHGELAALHWSWVFPSDAPRFARMDLMCRLGLMAVELLDGGFAAMDSARRERFGVCVETAVGSLAADARFLQAPRPSVFTYTLPSTLIGEICIRYRLQGPLLCLLAQDRPERDGVNEAAHWIEEGEAHDCLCVVCEAVDATLVRALPASAGLEASSWQAAAVWLGAGAGSVREHPLAAGSLLDTCRALCQRPG
jgi:3-oxoacyl-(acyl-carrier-protein) synthase